MITPKPYQSRVLDSLRDFFRIAARMLNPEPAFREITARTFGTATPYIPVSVAGMKPQMPYVCLRVPTGGGKTLLACHAAGLAMTQDCQTPERVTDRAGKCEIQILSKKLLHTAWALVVSSPLRVQARGQLVCGPITVPLRGRD